MDNPMQKYIDRLNQQPETVNEKPDCKHSVCLKCPLCWAHYWAPLNAGRVYDCPRCGGRYNETLD